MTGIVIGILGLTIIVLLVYITELRREIKDLKRNYKEMLDIFLRPYLEW